MIETPLTDLLGIRYPVVQAAMGYVSGPRLAAATSDAGGLGLIASATMSLAELEKAIEETAGRTAGPFGVNLRADAQPDAAIIAKLKTGERVSFECQEGDKWCNITLASRQIRVDSIESNPALLHRKRFAAQRRRA